MEASPHVFMVGEGAETFGRQHGVDEVDPSWFYTEQRWEALQRAREPRPWRSPGTSTRTA
jgi:L-asparaginase / beta-aspartyl-peptidase